MSAPPKARLSSEVASKIRAYGAETYPHECCGALLGKEKGNRKQPPRPHTKNPPHRESCAGGKPPPLPHAVDSIPCKSTKHFLVGAQHAAPHLGNKSRILAYFGF